MANEQEQAAVQPEKKTTHIVVDNTNLAAVLADARGEAPPAKEAEKPAEEAKAETVKTNGADDEVGDDGLTNTQREDPQLTEKMKKAIGKQYRLRKEAEELAENQFNERKLADSRADRLERENARLKEQLTPPKIEPELKKPVKSDYKTDDEYIEAVADYRADLKIKAKEEADHKKAVEEMQRETVAKAESRIAEARKIVPDFDEVLASVNDDEHPVSDTIAGYMQESELFAELGYHFAKNPEVLDSIMKLTPAKQLVAIGKIEAILKPFGGETPPKVEPQTGAKPETKDGAAAKPTPSTNGDKPSKARVEPIKPIDTSSAAQVQKPRSEMTFAEIKADWAKRHQVNLTVRKRH